MKRTFALLALLAVLPGCALKDFVWMDDKPRREPQRISRASTEGGTRSRDASETRPYTAYRERYADFQRSREHRPPDPPRERPEQQPTRVYSYVQARHGRCAAEVSAVGTEHYSEDEAKRAAIKSWMAEVRHKLGTEMMDINNALDLNFRCVISTPGDRVTDKIAQWTRGDLLKECRIVARPCRPEVDRTLPPDPVQGGRTSSTTGADEKQ